jgi:hypothetical protein
LYSTNPESGNNKNRRCDESKEITDGRNGKYLRWYRICKEGEVEVINIFFWDVTLEKMNGDWFWERLAGNASVGDSDIECRRIQFVVVEKMGL